MKYMCIFIRLTFTVIIKIKSSVYMSYNYLVVTTQKSVFKNVFKRNITQERKVD